MHLISTPRIGEPKLSPVAHAVAYNRGAIRRGGVAEGFRWDQLGVDPSRQSVKESGLNKRKLLQKLLDSPTNARFGDVCRLVEGFGFRLARVTGSHHIYTHHGIVELVNLQEVGGEAKPYQVRQFLRLVERYNLKLEEES